MFASQDFEKNPENQVETDLVAVIDRCIASTRNITAQHVADINNILLKDKQVFQAHLLSKANSLRCLWYAILRRISSQLEWQGAIKQPGMYFPFSMELLQKMDAVKEATDLLKTLPTDGASQEIHSKIEGTLSALAQQLQETLPLHEKIKEKVEALEKILNRNMSTLDLMKTEAILTQYLKYLQQLNATTGPLAKKITEKLELLRTFTHHPCVSVGFACAQFDKLTTDPEVASSQFYSYEKTTEIQTQGLLLKKFDYIRQHLNSKLAELVQQEQPQKETSTTRSLLDEELELYPQQKAAIEQKKRDLQHELQTRITMTNQQISCNYKLKTLAETFTTLQSQINLHTPFSTLIDIETTFMQHLSQIQEFKKADFLKNNPLLYEQERNLNIRLGQLNSLKKLTKMVEDLKQKVLISPHYISIVSHNHKKSPNDPKRMAITQFTEKIQAAHTLDQLLLAISPTHSKQHQNHVNAQPPTKTHLDELCQNSKAQSSSIKPSLYAISGYQSATDKQLHLLEQEVMSYIELYHSPVPVALVNSNSDGPLFLEDGTVNEKLINKLILEYRDVVFISQSDPHPRAEQLNTLKERLEQEGASVCIYNNPLSGMMDCYHSVATKLRKDYFYTGGTELSIFEGNQRNITLLNSSKKFSEEKKYLICNLPSTDLNKPSKDSVCMCIKGNAPVVLSRANCRKLDAYQELPAALKLYLRAKLAKPYTAPNKVYSFFKKWLGKNDTELTLSVAKKLLSLKEGHSETFDPEEIEAWRRSNWLTKLFKQYEKQFPASFGEAITLQRKLHHAKFACNGKIPLLL